MKFIGDLVEYDYTVQKYFFPVLADEKKNINIDDYAKEIKKLKEQKDRLKKAYTTGVLKLEDFTKDYKLIENKIDLLETKNVEKIIEDDVKKDNFMLHYDESIAEKIVYNELIYF